MKKRLIQLIDDRSLALVMREAKDDGRKALGILRNHYAGKGKPRVIALYIELTSLRKNPDQSATDYILKAEKITNSLRNTGATVSDSFIIAMLLKGLPSEYKPFVAVVTQSDDTHKNFPKFKVAFRNFEDTEQTRVGNRDSVMKSHFRSNYNRHKQSGDKTDRGAGVSKKNLSCFSCGMQGHKDTECRNKQSGKLRCKVCKNNTHNLLFILSLSSV